MAEEDLIASTIDFVPAICFVPRGVAKEKPDKIELNCEELSRIIKETKESLEEEDDENGYVDDDVDDNDDENDDADIDKDANENGDMDIDDMPNPNGVNATQEHRNNKRHNEDDFAFENYDNEGSGQLANIHTVVDHEHIVPDEENDSEAEDDIIKLTDNLLIVGHVQGDAASLEIWIFNEVEESLYTFHDFLLPSFPLCIEWLNYDPGSATTGNMCAIGSMDPVITIWDLDVQNSLKPAFKLGSKGSRKKKTPAYGHKDAVLDLSWNRHYEHILASGSVDKSLLLWDLDEGQPHTSVTIFKDKLQSIEFHPDDAHLILTGCADGHVRLIDCRSIETDQTSTAKWKMNNEVEKVLWNPNDKNYFMLGNSTGDLYYADKRQNKKFLWSNESAHDEEISGICFNTEIPNLLTSTSTDGFLKIWNFNSSELKPVYTHNFKLGRLQCMKQCPEDPFTLAFGGEKPPRCVVYNIKNFEAVRRTFNIDDVLQN